MWVHELADADARCGGKAANLARLIAAGLPVPPGFVIDARAFDHVVGAGGVALDEIGHALGAAQQRVAVAPIPAELSMVLARAAALGAIVVRSSATIEDGNAGAGAGVFASSARIEPGDVWSAIRMVWTSALTPLAASYARRRDAAISIAVPMAVIVQQFVEGEPVTIYTRPLGAPTADEVLVQRGASLARVPRSSTDPLVILALRAEAAIGATAGADVELVDALAPAVVQARPMMHPVRAQRSAAPPMVTALLVADGRRWTWDIAHNPDPLSTAQAELVERVDAATIAPYALRVCAGYLYSAPRRAAETVRPPDSSGNARNQGRAPSVAALDAGLAERIVDIESRLAVALGVATTPDEAGRVATMPVLSLDAALERYLQFYAVWASELSPLITAHRRTELAAVRVARPSAVEALLLRAARGEIDEGAVLDRLGVLSPAWDVAVPTYGERPAVVREAIRRATEVAAIAAREEQRASEGESDTISDLAERDDFWFACAQLLVRRALLARGAALQLEGDDVFWLPFAALADGITGDDAKRRAAAAKAAAARAARWDMPIVVGGEPVAKGAPLRGVGSGGRVRGRVVRFATLASMVSVGRGDVVVVRAVTPALAVMMIGCAALVSETGGLLDHGAAMARELGIPCVVGCTDAWSALDDGMHVTVDGDAGTVTPTQA